MWLVTEDGFFSAVNGVKFPMGFEAESERFDLDKYRRSEYLMVRSRDSDSMDCLKERLLQDNAVGKSEYDGWPGEGWWTGKVLSDGGTDYEHRMLIPRKLFAHYVSICADNINYRSFKTHMAHAWSDRYGLGVARGRGDALLDAWFAFKDHWPTDESAGDESIYADS